MNSTLKSKSREHAQKDIADALKESISEYAVELIDEVASSLEDGTRNAKARQAILGKHIGVEEILAMAPTDFTDQFFANLLSGNQGKEGAVVSSASSSSVGNNTNNPSNTIGMVNPEQKKPNAIPSVNPFQRQTQAASGPPVPVLNNRIAGKSRYVNPNAAVNASSSSYSSFQQIQPLPEFSNNNNNLNPELLPNPVLSLPTDEQQYQQSSQQYQSNVLEHAPTTAINLIHPVGIENNNNEPIFKTLQSQANQHISQSSQDGNIQQQLQQQLQPSNQTTTPPPPPPIQVPRIPPRIGPPQPPSIAKTQPQPFRPVPNQQQQHLQSQQQQPSVQSQTPNVSSSLNSSTQPNSNAVTNPENQSVQTKVPSFLSSSPPAQLSASPQAQQHSQQFQQNSQITPAVQDKQQPTTQNAPVLFSNPTRSTTHENIPEKDIISSKPPIVVNDPSFVPFESKSIKDKPTNPLQQQIPQNNLKPTEPTNLTNASSSQQFVSEQLNQTKDDLLEECMHRIKLTQTESHKALTYSIDAAIEPFSRRLLAVEKMLAASSDQQNNINGLDHNHSTAVSETIQILQNQNEQLSKEVALLREEKMTLNTQVDELTRKNVALSEESQKVVALNQQITQQNHLYSEENQQLLQQNHQVITEAQSLQKEVSAVNEQNQQLRDQLNQMQFMLQQIAQEQALQDGQVDNAPVNDQQEDLIGYLQPQIQATSGAVVVSEGITVQSVREDIVDNVQAEDFFDSLNGCQQVDQQHTHQQQQQQTSQAQQAQSGQQEQFQQLPGKESISISSQGVSSKQNVFVPQPAGGAPLKQRRVAKGNEGMFS